MTENTNGTSIISKSLTLMELYFGALSKRELSKIKNRLQELEIVDLDKEITGTAVDLIEKYAKSHGLRIPDALIASTAICSGMKLLTFNLKDFKFIKGIRLYHEES